MIALLKLLNPKAWLYLGVAAAAALFVVGVYRAGGAAPRAQLEALTQSVKAARVAQVKEDARREAEHQSLIKEKDKDRAKDIALTNADWRSYLAGLPKPRSGAVAGAQPVRIAAEGLDGAADRDKVSAAVSEFRDEVRAAVREFRDEVAGQLEQAQLQTDALIRAQAWAGEEQKINR